MTAVSDELKFSPLRGAERIIRRDGNAPAPQSGGCWRSSVELHHDAVAEEVGVRQSGRAVENDAERRSLALQKRRGFGDLAADGHGIARFLYRGDPNGPNSPREGDPA